MKRLKELEHIKNYHMETIYNNETGEIISINKKTGKLIVKGINFKSKYTKPRFESEIGEIKQIEGSIDHSNVKILLSGVQ